MKFKKVSEYNDNYALNYKIDLFAIKTNCEHILSEIEKSIKEIDSTPENDKPSAKVHREHVGECKDAAGYIIDTINHLVKTMENTPAGFKD